MHIDHQEAFVLAVLNSTPTVAGVRQDLLVGADGALLVHPWGDGSDGSRRALVAARDVVQRIVATGAVDSHLGTVLTRRVIQRPQLRVDGLAWELQAPTHLQLAIRFLSEWTELTARHPGRLKRCANPDCSLFLLDRSNANARHWCAMSSCGNRMKARRHHRRTAGQAGAEAAAVVVQGS